MTLNQLRYFCAASRYHSITKAAQSLYITQPTISIAIRELEEEFHTLLFYRTGNQLVLTREGEIFYEKATYLLQCSDAIHSQFTDIASYRPTLKVGIPPMLSTIYFPELLDGFHEEFPDIQVELTEYGSVRVCELVQDDVLDLGLINMEVYNIDKFNSQTIANEQLMFCVGSNHPLASQTSITLEQLKEERLILFNADSVQNQLIEMRFSALDIKPSIILRSSQLFTTLKFLKKGDCGCFLFSNILPLFPELAGIPIQPAIPVKIGLIWKKGKYINGGIKLFIDFTEDFLKKARL